MERKDEVTFCFVRAITTKSRVAQRGKEQEVEDIPQGDRSAFYSSICTGSSTEIEFSKAYSVALAVCPIDQDSSSQLR